MKFSFKIDKVKEENIKYRDVALKNSDTVYENCQDMLEAAQEMVVVFDLTNKLKIIDRRLVSLGSLGATVSGPREIFRGAIVNNAAVIIIVHNHPSGDPSPSEQDKEFTKGMVRAGALLGIEVVEHLVVGRDGYYSFREHYDFKDEDFPLRRG